MVKFVKCLLPIQEDEPQWVVALFSEISESSDTEYWFYCGSAFSETELCVAQVSVNNVRNLFFENVGKNFVTCVQ